MKMSTSKKSLCGLSVVMTAILLMISAGVLAADFVTFTRDARYPARCSGDQPGETGVCVLGSILPKAENLFAVFDANTRRFVDDIYLNSVRPLEPGSYFLIEYDAPYEEYRYPFIIREGEITTIKTATLSLRTDSTVDFQGAHDEEMNDTCVDVELIEVLSKGEWAFIPGTYVVDYGADLNCSGNEVEVTLEAGKRTFIKRAR